jgi:hypothetical protein
MIEQFTRSEFYDRLPVDSRTKEPMFSDAGIYKGEYAYSMMIGEKFRFLIMSSIRVGEEVSSDAGENSIIIIVQRIRNGTWFAVGKGPDAWTTRQPGWEIRLKEKLHLLYKRWHGISQDFSDEESVFMVKKGKPENIGRIFAITGNDQRSFRWLD